MPSARFAALVLSLAALLACDDEEDPRPIMNACGFPRPCGDITDASDQNAFGPDTPLMNNACIHDVLADSNAVHVAGSWYSVWSGWTNWDFYTSGDVLAC